MSRRHIPGAVFVFVSAGEIAVARGYGAAELEPPRPVDPDRTQFRLASVSKVVTATAVMQLVEQGRLELHRPVKAYLSGVDLAEDRGAITLHHLLTHTAGFDERLTGIAARGADELQPLGEYLRRSIPAVFVEPGRVISYSNHGMALAGLLVERVSGRPFADYVRAQVFEPLGMSRSGALLATPPPDLAVAYAFADGRHHRLSPDYLNTTPAGAFFTTGTDMGRFLIAHLRGGADRARRILRPETVALMHAQHFAQVPGVSGWAYGLWEDARNDQRALLHNGGGKGYRALMYLLPDQDAGFFIAYNLADRHDEGELQEVFITKFRERFLPAPRGDDHASTESISHDAIAGEYLYVRRARTTMEAFISIVNRVRVSAGENRALSLTGSADGPVTLTPIASNVFRRSDGRGTVAFESGNDTTAPRLLMVTDSGFPAVYERVPLIATVRVQATWLAAMILIFVYAIVSPPSATMRAASALNLAFVVGFPPAFIAPIEGGIPAFAYGVPLAARALLVIPVITAVASAAAAIAIYRRRRTSPPSFADLLVVAAQWSFVAFAWYWNVLPTARM